MQISHAQIVNSRALVPGSYTCANPIALSSNFKALSIIQDRNNDYFVWYHGNPASNTSQALINNDHLLDWHGNRHAEKYKGGVCILQESTLC